MRLAAVAAAACLAVSACSGSPAAPRRTAASAHGHPDLAAFLALPVATPSSCPASVNGATVGRHSPWVGTVDVSVFLDRADPGAVDRLHSTLAALPGVVTVYFESQAQAYAEFQRLYTCSAAISPGSVPASFRLVLATMPLDQRDALVRRILRLPGVTTVSCDPSSPCVDLVATPSASGSP